MRVDIWFSKFIVTVCINNLSFKYHTFLYVQFQAVIYDFTLFVLTKNKTQYTKTMGCFIEKLVHNLHTILINFTNLVLILQSATSECKLSQ